MSRIPPVDRNTTDDSVRRNFDAVQKQLGVVPNMMRTMAQSPSVLEAYLGFGAALRRGRLPVALHEQIALAVAETNSCDYCLSAHTALGRGAGLSNDELAASRGGPGGRSESRRRAPVRAAPSSIVVGMFAIRISRVSVPRATPTARLRKSSRTWR